MKLHGHLPRATQPPDLGEYKQLHYAADRVDARTVNVSPLVQVREPAGRRQFRDCRTCDRRSLCHWDAFAYPDCEQPLDDGRKAGGRKPGYTDRAAAELYDLQVVVFVLAELLGVDVQAGALDKARADVERGKRGARD